MSGLNVGSTASKTYVGSTAAAKVYVGSTQAWSAVTPPAFNAVGAGAHASGSGSASYSHTVADNSVVLVWLYVFKTNGGANTAYTRSVTLGGSAMTSAGVIDIGNVAGGLNDGFIELFKATVASGGAKTVATSVTGVVPTSMIVGSASYTGVGSIGTAVTANGNASGAVSVTVPASSGSRIVAGIGHTKPLSAPTGTQRAIDLFDAFTANMLIEDKTADSAASLGATAASSGFYGIIGVELTGTP